MAGNTSLLSKKEHEVCKNLSSQRTLEGKRAKALLALNDEDTQIVAAQKSGLSYGQVKYLLTIFRKKGLSVISETTIEKKEPVAMKKVKAKDKKKEKGKKKKEKKEKKVKGKIKSKKDKQKKSKKKKSKKSKKK